MCTLSYKLQFGDVKLIWEFWKTPTAEREKVFGANWPQAKKFTKEFVDQHVSETGFVPKYLGKTDVFDRAKLLAQLSEQAQKPLDAVTFALANATVTEDGTKQRFVFETTRYEYA